MLALALLTAALPQAVTFQCSVEPLRYSLPELSKAMGRTLRADADMEWNTLYVKVKDADPQAVLDKIAFASLGVWETTADGSMTLREDRALLQARDAEDVAAWRKILKKELATPPPGEDQTTKVVRTVVNGLGMDRLAALEEDSRVAYSTRPTKMQKAITIAPKLIDTLVLLRNESIAKERQSPPEAREGIPPEYAKMLSAESLEMVTKMADRPKAMPISEPVWKVNLIVYRRGSSLDAQLNGYSSDGERLVSGRLYIRDPASETEPKEDAKPKTPARPLKLSEATTEFVGLTKTFFDMWSWEARNPQAAPNADERRRLRAMIPDPEHTDPYLVLQTELLEMALKKPNVIALVDAWTLAPDYDETMTTEWLQARIDEFDKSETEQWSVLRPAEMYYPVDRSSFKRALAIADVPRLNMDQRAELAYLEQSGDLGGVQDGLVDALLLDDSPQGTAPRTMLSLYWSLGQTKREQLKSGKPVPFSALSRESSAMLSEMAFGQETELENGWYRGEADDLGYSMVLGLDEMIKLFYEASTREDSTTDILEEPTETLPYGLPPDGQIRLKFTEEEAYTSVKPPPHDQSFDVLSLRRLLALFADPEGAPTGYRVVRQRQGEMSIVATPEYGLKAVVSERTQEPSEVKTVDSLGPEAKATLQKMRENVASAQKLREMFGRYYERKPPPD